MQPSNSPRRDSLPEASPVSVPAPAEFAAAAEIDSTPSEIVRRPGMPSQAAALPAQAVVPAAAAVPGADSKEAADGPEAILAEMAQLPPVLQEIMIGYAHPNLAPGVWDMVNDSKLPLGEAVVHEVERNIPPDLWDTIVGYAHPRKAADIALIAACTSVYGNDGLTVAGLLKESFLHATEIDGRGHLALDARNRQNQEALAHPAIAAATLAWSADFHGQRITYIDFGDARFDSPRVQACCRLLCAQPTRVTAGGFDGRVHFPAGK